MTAKEQVLAKCPDAAVDFDLRTREHVVLTECKIGLLVVGRGTTPDEAWDAASRTLQAQS